MLRIILFALGVMFPVVLYIAVKSGIVLSQQLFGV